MRGDFAAAVRVAGENLGEPVAHSHRPYGGMEPGVRRHGSQAVTTTTIVNKQFLEEHEQAVVEYLNMAGQSVAWTLGQHG